MIALFYYLLKVIVCSGVLFAYYYLALRNKRFHQWNRFYLLAAVVLSTSIPLLQFTFTREKEEPLQAIEMIGVVQSADIFIDEISTRPTGLFSSGELVATGYLLCSLVLLSTLLLSIFRIIMLLKSHQKKKIASITFIETKGIKGTPFSFLHYIFWNSAIDVNSSEGRQIFQHELVHVNEKHTLDKLFLQLTLSVFWLNPFFWLMRRELRMIHEFIADQKSVHDKDSSKLAAMILQTAYPGHFNGISNAFFQSSIKRRLLMLTKNQNPKFSYISRLLAVPIMAITIMAFTFKTQQVETVSANNISPITVVIDAGHGRMDNGQYNGARAGEVYEDQITLAIAKKIEELNKNEAIKIVLTRSTEATTELAKRVDVAAKEGAGLFLSVHVGANEANRDLSGMEVYVSSKNTGQNLQSELFGSALVNELQSVYKTNPELIKRQTGVWVIDKNVCPAVLIECGYLTNAADLKFISNTDNQEIVARKILNAIERFANGRTGVQRTIITDTVPAKKKTTDANAAIKPETKKIKSVDVIKPEAQIVITYEDGTIEKLTETEARKKGLLKKEDKASVVEVRGFQLKPLYYVDGKEFTGELNDIHPDNIESVNVLKNKPATDKYGDKGKNGVVEITLKKKLHTTGSTTSQLESIKASNKTTDSKTANTTIFDAAEIPPSVNRAEWVSFLENNVQSVVEDLAKNGAPVGQHTMELKFVVELNGSLSNIEVLTPKFPKVHDRLLALMQQSPKWKPAQQNGKEVIAYHIQPITFVISD